MWELIAAAAAGLNAGSGLYIAAAEHPAGLEAGVATYWSFFPKVSTKAVTLSTTLSVLTAAGAAAAYFTGEGLESGPYGGVAVLHMSLTSLVASLSHACPFPPPPCR